MNGFSNSYFIFLLVPLFFAGCNPQKPSEVQSPDSIAVPTLGISPPTPEMLAALGPENTVPTEFLLPNPILVVTGKPKQFLDSPVSKGGELLIQNFIARTLHLQKTELVNNVEWFIQANGIPFVTPIIVPSQDPTVPSRQIEVPIGRRTTLITFDTTITPSFVIEAMGFNPADIDAEKFETFKRTAGNREYYDLTPPDISIPQRLAVSLLDERTLLIFEGIEEDMKSIFSDTPSSTASAQNALLSRLKHTPVDNNELTLLTSLESAAMNPEMLNTILAPLAEAGYVPQNLLSAVQEHLRALTVSLQVSVAEGEPVVSVYAEGRDEEGAKMLGEAVQGIITNAQVAMVTMSEEMKQLLPVPAVFADSLWNEMSVTVEGTKMVAVLNNFPSLIPTVAEGLQKQQTSIQESMRYQYEEQLIHSRLQQLQMLANWVLKYNDEQGKFPADITDAEGNPLLSWRVALLSQMGLDDLYQQFNLDEPWDSETNLKVLETANPIYVYHPRAEGIPHTKTLIRFFDLPDTPLSNKDRKLEDLASHQETIMFIEVTPEYAVEWTKPSRLELDMDKIGEILTNPLLGVSYAGNPVVLPIVPKDEARYEEWKQFIVTIMTGNQAKTGAGD